MSTLKEMKARLWHADLRLWMWKWQTLSPKDRAVFYRGRKSGQKGTRHKSLKIFNTYTQYRLWKLNRPKQFDAPYLLTMGAGNGGSIRFQLLPASMHGHRINLVSYFITVNYSEPKLEIWSGNFHCVDCKLMGTEHTMKEYSCFKSNRINWMEKCGCSQCKRNVPCTWAEVSRICHGEKDFYVAKPKAPLLMHYRRDYYIPTEEDLDKYSSIRTEAGWWKRKFIQDEAGRYGLERKWIKPS